MKVVRLEDAAEAARQHNETHYAYLRFDVMAPDEIAIAIIQPDPEHGWRMTILQGSYGGTLRSTNAGPQPSRGMRKQMINQVFHPAAGEVDMARVVSMADGAVAQSIGDCGEMTAVEAVRVLEGYDEDVILHPDAVRTVVRAHQARDARVPNATPSNFSGVMRFAGIAAGVLLSANAIALVALFATWGDTPGGIRQIVVTITLGTLAALSLSPLIIMRLSRESRLFVSDVAQQEGRTATLRVGQIVILLALLSLVNALTVLN